MATPEQKAASGRLMKAVDALNEALQTAGSEQLFVELRDVGTQRYRKYIVETIEARETVLPEPRQ